MLKALFSFFKPKSKENKPVTETTSVGVETSMPVIEEKTQLEDTLIISKVAKPKSKSQKKKKSV